MGYEQAVADLRTAGDPVRAVHSASYFKTGPGQYGEGDIFWGLRMGDIHRLARGHQDLSRRDLQRLLASPVHEQRMLALLILRRQFDRAARRASRADARAAADQQALYRFYVAHMARINNWDLVDCSAPYVVGRYLQARSRRALRTWARSPNLWRRRVAIIANLWWIRDGDFADALAIATALLGDGHDLIHKAVGWVLREIDKRDHAVAVRFLARHYARLPRTALRYAIERFPEAERRAALQGRFATGTTR